MTDKQVKEFWGKCGFKWQECKWDCPFSPDEHTLLTPKTKHIHLVYPDGSVLLNTTGYYTPPVDLSNLFKYAMPKAIDKIMEEHECSSDLAYAILFKRWLRELVLDMERPAETLMKVIWEVVHR